MAAIPLYYSCYSSESYSKEQFITDHFFTCLLSGTYAISDSVTEHLFHPPAFFIIKRNRLGKFVKKPPQDGEFRSVSILLDQDFLKQFAREYKYKAERKSVVETVTIINHTVLLEKFMESLTPYLSEKPEGIEDVFELKKKELLLLLLKTDPELKDILFDFDEPGKVNLENFMNANFRFNVSMERFAYLTGRSLATFKRDFRKIFHETPGRWLLERRLKEAYYLINKQKEKPSDIYLKVGFEDLSHFSFAFKKQFGVNPSSLI